ncbi:MAG: carbamoyl-phosphate synthase large subunit [Acidimicrobiales bacterium]
MPKRTDIESIIVVGSGPIVIGQACEFDYSGTQACKVLREEGYRIILVNSNPATIMTDPDISDRTYIEPLDPGVLEAIIEREHPDALLPTLGGQTALNLAMSLSQSGVLDAHGVQLIGASVDAISTAEDRELFKEAMESIGLEVPSAGFAHCLDEAVSIAADIGFPVMVRPSYVLGGAGTGTADDLNSLRKRAAEGLEASPVSTILVERSIAGWKEYELELMRDRAGKCVVVCSIENFDPMGVHTGDSITVAPAQTLSDWEYQQMRDDAFACIRKVGVETGGSNIQFAINPRDGSRMIIEMNPRVSRSSALASKATGFPIAKIAAKLAVGYTLDEIPNDITSKTPACFEPSIDYVVTKVPRWAFEKLPGAPEHLGTRMQSVGEVMAIGRTFPESLQKALRSLERGHLGLNADPYERTYDGMTDDKILAMTADPTPDRVFHLGEALRRGIPVETLVGSSGIDRWFLDQIKSIAQARLALDSMKADGVGVEDLDSGTWITFKKLGFSDGQIAYILGCQERNATAARLSRSVIANFGSVDTCAGEFEAFTPYLYSTYDEMNEVPQSAGERVIILGSGPNRIGQGVEFDYCCVHAAMALRDAGYETVMVNCNPETVSTDYDTSDRLYFEPLTLEDLTNVISSEQLACTGGGRLKGVIVSLGGQTPLKLASGIDRHLVLGTAPSSIDTAEDRGLWSVLLAKLGILQPPGGMASNMDEALDIASRIGYPVLVRPSYVLGGRAMEIVYEPSRLNVAVGEIQGALEREGAGVKDLPILVDKFLEDAIEVDVDAIRDRLGEVYIGGIMEHVEEAGIHSGDSACVIPPPTLPDGVIATLRSHTSKIAENLEVAGLINIQFAVKDGEVYVIEANPRASRTVPFVSKATGVPLAKIAARVMVGDTLEDLRREGMLAAPAANRYFSVKEAVLPFARFPGVDSLLGPEMRSTGEVMGVGESFGIAFAKSQLAAVNSLPQSGTVFMSLAARDKEAGVEAALQFQSAGFSIAATTGTARYFEQHGIHVKMKVAKMADNMDSSADSSPGSTGESESSGGLDDSLHDSLDDAGEILPTALDLIKSGQIQLVVNTPRGRGPRADGMYIRNAATAAQIPCITTISAAKALATGIKEWSATPMSVISLQDMYRDSRIEA